MKNLNQQQNPIIADGEITTDSEGRFNLNTLHKASGTGPHKKPSEWLRNKQAQELTQELIKTNICALPISKNHGGLNPGTFAHEILAISYAGWLSPKFQLQVNQAFLDYKSGKLESKPLTRYEIFQLGLEAEKKTLGLEM